jgi:multiple sugar transport system permease protein
MTASAPSWRLSGGQRRHLGGAQRSSRLVSALVVFVILAALLVFFVLPAIWLVLAPTKTASQLDHAFPLSFGSFGQLGQAWHDLTTFEGGVIWQWLRNSAVYSAGALALTLVTSVPAGYALAMTKFRGRKLLLTVTLVVMIMPSSALVLPIFLELNLFHLIGTVWSIVLPFSFYPFGVYLVYIYFATSLPRDMLAAARIDGASEWRVFTRIALPLARASQQQPVSDPGRPEPAAVLHPGVQPGGGQGPRHHQPGARPGDHHLDPAGAGAVPLLAAGPRLGNARRRD